MTATAELAHEWRNPDAAPTGGILPVSARQPGACEVGANPGRPGAAEALPLTGILYGWGRAR